MIVMWNDHIKIFILYWISSSEKYMSVWMNIFTFQGFFFGLCKHHSKGIKYHTICFSESGIMYEWEIVEGGYYLIPMGIPQFEISPNVKMVVLIIRLTRVPWIDEKSVVLDIGFCVLRGLLEANNRGVYGSLLIKRVAIGLGDFIEM